MYDDEMARGIEQNKALKKLMLERHRPAFDLWFRLAQVLEEAVVKERMVDSAFGRALDLFFLQTFKSHQSLYPLCVMGHGEDAATIARRLLEISLQVGHLVSEESKREEHGEAYLAHFWHNAADILAKTELPEAQRKWWEQHYQLYKPRLKFNSKGRPANTWFGSNFAGLAATLGLQETYEKDYRFLSNVAHCSSRGLLLEKINNAVQIKSEFLVPEILVYGSKYTLWITANWNEHFALIEPAKLEQLRDEAINFRFKKTHLTLL